MRRLSVSQARELSRAAFAAVDLSSEQAEICTNAILFASLRGLDSHGIISILPGLVGRIARGQIDRSAPIQTIRNDTVTALLKGNGTIGPVMAEHAMRQAIAKAKEHGVGIVVGYNCDHFGAASYYSSLAAEQGLIGVVMCNAAPNVAPFGGTKGVHGTNPISYAIPGRQEGPLVLDIATSTAAHGQISKARRRGQALPAGWAIDGEGRPTTDPTEAAALLPFGGHKGYGIGLLVDALTGALAGWQVTLGVTQGEGEMQVRGQSIFMQAIDPERFAAPGVFRERVDQIVRDVRSIPPAEGFREVLLPGDLEERQQVERTRLGIPLYDEDWDALSQGLVHAGVSASIVSAYTPAVAE
ncbi:MAG TPA: Ldh family oxidoreductase [Chloroflexota bacterium]|nr:Ldh family oxidoreductase [Chloroflexota bacterium]